MKKDYAHLWTIKIPLDYSKNSNAKEVVWNKIFMPFDIFSGLDSCPPDNSDYSEHTKTHWWVAPKTKAQFVGVQDISYFIDMPKAKEFVELSEAINYCTDWREKWLEAEMKIGK